jgi:hypothetical protein
VKHDPQEPGPQHSPWDPHSDIDWRVAPTRPRWLPPRNHAMVVSQFLHGETVALEVCRRLAATLHGTNRAALERQAEDEARHVEAYRLYLARLGELRPRATSLERVVEAITSWQGPPAGLLLANHIVLEGEALAVQHELGARFPCPLLRQLARRVMRDEARHVALGRAMLRSALAALSPDERFALYDWLRRLWHDGAKAAARDHGGMVFARVAPRGAITARWARRRAALERVGLIEGADPRFAA